MESKKHTSMHFTFDLDMRAYFGLGDPFERHSKLWRLVSGSYWKNQLSLPMITLARLPKVFHVLVALSPSLTQKKKMA